MLMPVDGEGQLDAIAVVRLLIDWEYAERCGVCVSWCYDEPSCRSDVSSSICWFELSGGRCSISMVRC